MDIDFKTSILGIDGAAEMRAERDSVVPVALGWVCRTALGGDLPADQGSTADQKLHRIALALRIPPDGMGDSVLALNTADVSFIIDRVSSVFGALMTYRVIEILDPARLPK